MNRAGRTPFDALMPVWVALSVLLHAVVVVAASGAISPRVYGRANAQPMRVIVAGQVKAARATPPAEGNPARTTIKRPRPVSKEREQPAAAERKPIKHVREPAAAQSENLEPQTVEGWPSVGKPMQEIEPSPIRQAPGRWITGPGADNGEPAAGGGSQILARAMGSAGGFSVAIPPAGGGRGIGVGGSGSGLGVGGSGSGVSMGKSAPGKDTVVPAARGAGRGGFAGGGAASGGGASTGSKQAGPATPKESAPSGPQPPDEPGPEPKRQIKPEPAPKLSKADLSAFSAMVQRRIAGAKRYPSEARQRGIEGTVKVSFRVSPAGRPTDVRVILSSGHRLLDTAALRAVRRAVPFLPFPKGVNKSIKVTAKVVFRLD